MSPRARSTGLLSLWKKDGTASKSACNDMWPWLSREVGIRVFRVESSGVVFAAFTLVAAARAQAPLELPVFAPPSGAVAPFVLKTGDHDRARAIRCLTQAIYYEAASEPRAGQEAVAQVVLNRLKHPAFPKSVCGVVYEGSERGTGCQFTFTCDGSLARSPVLLRWDAAEQVATAALSGHVANQVGSSTHYHAAWMTPYWSASLVRTQQIGGHVFYRMPGAAGSPEALNGQYEGARAGGADHGCKHGASRQWQQPQRADAARQSGEPVQRLGPGRRNCVVAARRGAGPGWILILARPKSERVCNRCDPEQGCGPGGFGNSLKGRRLSTSGAELSSPAKA